MAEDTESVLGPPKVLARDHGGQRVWCARATECRPRSSPRTFSQQSRRYASMFFVTTSIVSFSSAVGLNSTISVFGKISGVWPGPT